MTIQPGSLTCYPFPFLLCDPQKRWGQFPAPCEGNFRVPECSSSCPSALSPLGGITHIIPCLSSHCVVVAIPWLHLPAPSSPPGWGSTRAKYTGHSRAVSKQKWTRSELQKGLRTKYRRDWQAPIRRVRSKGVRDRGLENRGRVGRRSCSSGLPHWPSSPNRYLP